VSLERRRVREVAALSESIAGEVILARRRSGSTSSAVQPPVPRRGASNLTELLGELVDRVGADPTSSFVRTMSFPQTRRFWANLGADEAATDGGGLTEAPHVLLFARSQLFARPLPAEAIEVLLATFARGRATGEERELDFMPWGGAYNRVRPGAAGRACPAPPPGPAG
jgi:hypothetical protein